jgi:hypothetical protein
MTIQLDLSLVEGIMRLTGLVLRSSVSSLRGIRQCQAAVVFDRPLEIFADPLAPIEDDSQSPHFKSPSFDLVPSAFGASLYEPDHCGYSAMIAAFLAITGCNASDAVLDEVCSVNDW